MITKNCEPNNVVGRNEVSLLRRKSVLDMTGLSRSGLYARIKEGKFPAPVNIGAKSVAWVSTEVQQWIKEKIEARGVKYSDRNI